MSMFGKKDYQQSFDSQLARPERADALSSASSKLKGTRSERGVRWIPVDRITVRKQIREEFDDEELRELADSMVEHNQIQPGTVFWSNDEERFVLVAGERRFRAAQLAGKSEYLATVLEQEPSAQEMHEIQLIENVQRKDLNPIEEAKAYQRFVDEFGMSQSEIAKKTGKNQSSISRALQLLKLPAEILDDIDANKVPRRIAEALVKLATIEEQRSMLERYKSGELTVHAAQQETSKRGAGSKKGTSVSKQVRVKKVDGIELKATGKKRHTTTDYALATLDWCQDLAATKRGNVDLEAIRNRVRELLEQLNGERVQDEQFHENEFQNHAA